MSASSDPPSTSARPVQLGLIEGSDKNVGPLLTSVISGSNADLIAAVAPLYLAGSVLDVTYGRGMWWRRFTPEPFGHHDLAVDGVDFRDLPHEASSWDAVCFDPPYVPQGGTRSLTSKAQNFRESFGLHSGISELALRELTEAGLGECARVARRFVLAKCTDYTNGKAFHLGHCRMIRAGEDLGLTVQDLFVHNSGTGPGGHQIEIQHRARRAHSYLVVFEKVRTL